MQEPSSATLRLVADVLQGAPLQLLTLEQRVKFLEFCGILDNFGFFLDEEKEEEPSVDKTALAALLDETLGAQLADHLLGYLYKLPGSRLVSVDSVARSRAVPWFVLAQHVVIFDQTPDTRFVAELSASPTMWELIDEVQKLFPSLEVEMIDPQVLPAQLEKVLWSNSTNPALVGLDPSLEWILDLLYRNLGWWAVLGFALMAAAAKGSAPPGWAAWPLYVYVLAACMGGWTLTVLGGCTLSRVTTSGQ
jgi:hypothetical protein